MDQDDELFSSILSMCEETDAPAGDEETSVTKATNAEAGSELPIGKDTSVSLSPIKHATPLKMADTLNNNNTSFMDNFTPKAKSGIDLFKSMLQQQMRTSTPLMDRWSLTKPGRSREGKRRHDVDAVSINLETITEQESSDEDETPQRSINADKTYDDLLQDLTILCEKELTERCEIVNAEPPEYKIKAEHQISRINLNSILQETTSTARMVRDNVKDELGPTASQSEPGRFTGVNTTTQSSVMAVDDSDSFEDADDILGLDDFLGSDEEDNDYDSLLEDDSIFQDNDITVIKGSSLSTSLQTRPSAHKVESSQKIPTYKCINSSVSPINANTFPGSSSISVKQTSELVTSSVSIDTVVSNATDTATLTKTTGTDTSSSIVSTSAINLNQSVIVVSSSETVLSSKISGIEKEDKKLHMTISSEKSTTNSTVSDFDSLQLKTISVYENSSVSTCSHEKTLTTKPSEFSDKENNSTEDGVEEDVPNAERLSQEDEFTLDLTKDSDELEEFLCKEGYKVIDDLKNSTTDREISVNKSLVKKDQESQIPKCSTSGDIVTGNRSDHFKRKTSPRCPKKGQAEENHEKKDLHNFVLDARDICDSLEGQKVKQTSSGEKSTEQTAVRKVVAWQASCDFSEQDNEKLGSNDSKSQSLFSSHQTVPHAQHDRKTLPQVHVQPFKMQAEPEQHTPASVDSTKVIPSASGKNSINSTVIANVSALHDSSKTKTESTLSSPPDSQEIASVANTVDTNQNIVTSSFYHDYEAERRFIQGENNLMKQVMRKWGSQGIQTPDTNLSFSNRMRKNNPHYHSRLEGQKISTMWIGSDHKQQHHKEAKRFRSDIHSQLNNINNLKQQLQDINRAVREEIDQSIFDFQEKHNTLDRVFVQRKQALNIQQQLEVCQARRHVNQHMLQCQLLQLRCEHQHQHDQLTYILNTEMNQLKVNHQEHVHSIRSRFEQRAQQLKSFIEQLASVELTQTDPQFGPHVVTHLVKGPCRSNNNKLSTVTVCLPADIATAIIKEDEVYDRYYVHTKK